MDPFVSPPLTAAFDRSAGGVYNAGVDKQSKDDKQGAHQLL
jgi:hypothetical protein